MGNKRYEPLVEVPETIYCEFSGRTLGALGMSRHIKFATNCEPDKVLPQIYEKYENVRGLCCCRMVSGEKESIQLPAQNWNM